MTEPPSTPIDNRELELLLADTGRSRLDDALDWIARGYPLADNVDRHRLLQAVVRLAKIASDDSRDFYQAALQVLTRSIAQSDIDSAAVLLKADAIAPAQRFHEALSLIARFSPDRRLANVNPSAVLSAQRESSFAIEALCAVAGLSYTDLMERVKGLPADPRSTWTPVHVRSAFAEIDAIVNGRSTTSLPGAIPMRPLDLMPLAGAPPGAGWEQVEGYFLHGVPYSVLLAQRMAGGAWLAHRNATSGLVNHQIADQLCEALAARGRSYRRSTLVGGGVAPSVIQEIAGSDKQTGVVVLDRRGRAAYAIVLTSARDSGTASKSAARLRAMHRNPRLPTAILLTGRGWAARNETADLALAFDGRIYSERGIAALVEDVARASPIGPDKRTDID